jgi:4-diphosphocytidyl-2-C-methyl-D-erythritol kinase
MARLRVLAPAKVNLTLEVLGRRADGYHEIRSVMATCDLRDDVRAGPAKTLDVRIRPDVGAAAGEDLASLAVRALADATGHAPQAHVHVRKRIPVAAGLGGGSSDAGAVLRALAALWATTVDVVAVGARVGSDVPFFAAGCAVAEIGGRGEAVVPLTPAEGPWVVIVTLAARSATPEVYAALDPGARGDGRATAALADLFRKGAATGPAIRTLLRNDLATAAAKVCPAVAEARAAAARRGIELSVSGSGPSLFALADDRAHALRLTRSLRRADLRAGPYALFVPAPVLRI